MGNLLVWLSIYVFLIIGLFYFLYMATKTRSKRYAYPIAGIVILMIGMLFL